MAIITGSSPHAGLGLSPGARAAIYVRISRDPSGDTLGVKRQERECRELCQRLGLAVVAVFQDDDHSAFSGRPRPGYQAMLERLELGDFGVVAAWHPDRLHRSPIELEAFIDLLEQTGTTVVTVQGGDYDLATAAGRMTARVVGAVARHESEHKSERIRAKHRELVAAGKMKTGGGHRPFGYNAYERGSHRLTVRQDEAAIVKELAERYLAGESLRGLKADLDRRGVRTVTGLPWSYSSVRQTIMAPRVAGLYIHEGQLLPAPWPAIISPDEHHRVIARMKANTVGGRRSVRRHLLTGITICGRCGTSCRSTRVAGVFRYLCAEPRGGCGRVSIVARPVEERVVGALFDVVESHDFATRLHVSNGQPREVHDETESIERQMAELARMWATKQITRAEWLAARAELQDRLNSLRRQVSESTSYSPLDPWIGGDRSLRDDWEKLSLDQQRAIIAAVFRGVVIAPAEANAAPRFDSRRVTIERRF